MHVNSHGKDSAGINADDFAASELGLTTVAEGGPSPDYHDFDSSDIRWDMLRGLLNAESQFGMYLGGSILEGGEAVDMRADF